MEDIHFKEQMYTFHNFGYGLDPTGNKMIGDSKNIKKYCGKTAFTSGAFADIIKPKKRKLPPGDRIYIYIIIFNYLISWRY